MAKNQATATAETATAATATAAEESIRVVTEKLTEEDAVIADLVNHSNRQGNVIKRLDHIKREMAESLLQERQDLVGRVMRLDQRLAVLGFTLPATGFDLAVTDSYSCDIRKGRL